MYSYFKKDTIFASDVYWIYYGSPCKSHADRLLILHLLHVVDGEVSQGVLNLHDKPYRNGEVLSESTCIA